MLPYIKAAGYNAVLLLGVVEHPEYDSCGFKVSLDGSERWQMRSLRGQRCCYNAHRWVGLLSPRQHYLHQCNIHHLYDTLQPTHA